MRRSGWMGLAGWCGGVGLLAGCFLTPLPDEAPLSTPELSIAAGDATATSAVLWARTPAVGPLTARLLRDGDVPTLVTEWALEVTDALIPAKWVAENLAPGTDYLYDVIDADGAARRGRFRTPGDLVDGRRGLRFGVSGDWRGELAPYPAIGNAPGAGLDFFVALGDTVYVDVDSPALQGDARRLIDFRRKHAEIYGRRFGENSLSDLRAATLFYATIDDHEIGNDFSGGAAPQEDGRFASETAAFINGTDLFRNGVRAFQEYHPLADEAYAASGEPRFAGVTRLYRYRTFGRDAALFVLDARSFRDPPLDVGLLDTRGFFRAAFEPGRTLLGRTQFADLQRDLRAAEAAGVTWKFICLPEPIQNLGPILGTDRYEGYAAERAELLAFIAAEAIRNVVFISADIHCTIINNLTYQTEAGGPHLPSTAFEVVTGAVAYAAPFGPTTARIGIFVPAIGPPLGLLYSGQDRLGKDLLLTAVLDRLLVGWGYDPIGLDGSAIPFERTRGGWTSLHTYGWTQFDVDGQTQQLRVTTWGIDWYSERALLTQTDQTLSRVPVVVSEFTVDAR